MSEIRNALEQQTLDFHGVSDWHSRGFKGQGINFLELEGDTKHCRDVIDSFRLIAPEATVFSGNDKYSTIGDEVVFNLELPNGDLVPFKDFVRDNNIHIIAQSVSGITHPTVIEDIIKDTGCILVCSGGNQNRAGVTAKMADIAMSVGAIQLDGGRIVKESYSASGDDELDFATLHGSIEGTSFSSPTLAGLCALIMSRYGVIPQENMYEVLKSISLAAGDKGYDTDFGFGVPVLPESIEMLEQEETEEMEIKFKVGSKDIFVDGVKKELDVPAKVEDGRTLIPLRFFAEAFGATVDYNADTKEITVKK